MFDIETHLSKVRTRLAQLHLQFGHLKKVRRTLALCAAAHNNTPTERLLALLAHDIDRTLAELRPLLAHITQISGLRGLPVNPDETAKQLAAANTVLANIHARIGPDLRLDPNNWDAALACAEREAAYRLSYLAETAVPAANKIRSLAKGTALDVAMDMAFDMLPLEHIRLALGAPDTTATAPALDTVMQRLNGLLQHPAPVLERADAAIDLGLALLSAVQRDVQQRAATA